VVVLVEIPDDVLVAAHGGAVGEDTSQNIEELLATE